MKLGYLLPQIYKHLLPKSLYDLSITEGLATCDNCLMGKGKNPPGPGPQGPYKNDLKCCTYHPFMPNYLIGALLKNKESLPAAIQTTLENKIKNREYVLPVGFCAPIPYQIPFVNRQDGEFGNRADWLCPYYNKDQQNCGIWRERSAVCTTFYCRSSYGNDGLEFWGQFNDLLTYMEAALIEEVLVQMDFSPRQISECLGYISWQEGDSIALAKSKSLPEVMAKKLWNGYYDDQVGFFKKSHDIITNLTRGQLLEVMGDQGGALISQAEKASKPLQSMVN